MKKYHPEDHGSAAQIKAHEAAEGKKVEAFEAISENKKPKSKAKLFKMIARKRASGSYSRKMR